jgi:hypothetical protein
MVGMQTREVDQVVDIGGRLYDGAPWWSQFGWQWFAWPWMAVVQAVALVLVWALVPRRVAALVTAATAIPFLMFLTGNLVRLHWQATWQLGSALAVGIVIAVLLTSGRVSRVAVGAVLALVVVSYSVQRLVDVLDARPGDLRQADALVEVADAPGQIVVDMTGTKQLERSLSLAHPRPWNGVYQSANESMHRWFEHAGGTAPRSTPRRLRRQALTADRVSAVLVSRRNRGRPLPLAAGALESRYRRYAVGDLEIWLRNDLAASLSERDLAKQRVR